VTFAFLLDVLLGAGIVLAGLGGFWIVWPWIRTLLSGAPVPFLYFVAMRLHGTPVALVMDAHVSLRKGGRDISLELVEATYLAERGAIHGERDLVRRVEIALAGREASLGDMSPFIGS